MLNETRTKGLTEYICWYVLVLTIKLGSLSLETGNLVLDREPSKKKKKKKAAESCWNCSGQGAFVTVCQI